MSGQHTPGQLVLCEVGDYADYDGRCSVILECNEAGEIDRRSAIVLGDTEEDIALARLLAAAPELLEALKTTASNIRSLGPAGALGPTYEPYKVWLEVVDAAIAKASPTDAGVAG